MATGTTVFFHNAEKSNQLILSRFLSDILADSLPGLPASCGNNDTPAEPEPPGTSDVKIEATCRNCGCSWQFAATMGGQYVECNNCGDSVYVPSLRQFRYARRSEAEGGRIVGIFIFSVLGLIGLVVILAVAANWYDSANRRSQVLKAQSKPPRTPGTRSIASATPIKRRSCPSR